jgi:hypothetical protein
VKNRMLEIGTSGTVRGEDGNILTYSARGKLAVRKCVQVKLACSAGDRPAGEGVRAP